jgi:triosephosphate isomerase
MRRRKLIAANWKMHKTIAEATAFAVDFRAVLSSLPDCELLILPSFFCVRPVADALAGTRVAVGAQDLHWEASGAFTGEVSAAMVKDAGGSHALVGHSERRHVMGEADTVVARKLRAALGGGVTPVLCVGELLAEREAAREETVVAAQLESALGACTADDAARVVVAYEPVWAIGTGRTAAPADARTMHRAVRTWFGARFGDAAADRLRILYGGSARPDNAAELLGTDGVDGLLVGGASLEAASFAAIARAVPSS